MKLAISSIIAGSVLALACLSGAQAADSKAPSLYELMKNVVAVQTQVIWDIGNQAMDDQGNPDASKLKPADWDRIAAAGDKVRQAAQTLAQSSAILVVAPGQKIDGEGTPGAWGAKEVQKAINGNTAAFRAFANRLQVSMDQIAAAAQARNVAKLSDASNQLDQVCEQCHQQFWYPEQK